MHDSNKTELDLELDGALLARWREGDQQAINDLLALVLPWLHGVVSRALGNQPRGAYDSMDVAQSAVINFVRRGVRFVPATTTQFLALMKRIAINELRDAWRRQARAARVGGGRHLESLVNSSNPLSGFGGDNDSRNEPGRQAELTEEKQWVRLAMQFLDADDRWLVLAGEVEELAWAEVAAELGLAEDAARMRAKRLRPKVANLLRKLRAGYMPDGE
jgi:RNA polymerase sigma factor (sigma-70 family)